MHSQARRALSLATSMAGPVLAALVLVIGTGKRW
jgi:hypothetical protein